MIEVRTVSFGQFSGSYFTRRSFMSVMASVRDEVPRYTSYEGVGGWGQAGLKGHLLIWWCVECSGVQAEFWNQGVA